MPFRCPQCQTPDSLDIVQSMELPPDRQYDEISLQVVGCSACSFHALAVYEELVHGSEAESWRHLGFRISRDAVDTILEAMLSCPDPHNPRCECSAHISLGEQDMHGIWRGLLELERGQSFAMRLHHGNS